MFRLLVVLLLAVLTGCPSPQGSKIALTAEEVAYIEDHSVVTWAVEDNRPPYVFIDGNNVKGLSEEYLRVIAERTGLTFKPVRTITAAKSRQAVQDGTVDLLPAAFPLNHEEHIVFTPAFDQQNGVLVFVNEIKSRTPLTIAVSFSNPAKDYIRQRFPAGKILETEDDEESFVLLQRQLVDVLVMDEGTADYWIKRGKLKVRKAPIQFDYPYAFGYSRNNPVLGSIITKALNSLTPVEKSALNARRID